jgi:hypothetical protein
MGARPAGKRPGPAGAGSRRPAKHVGRCAPRADGEYPPASCRRSPRSGPARLRDPPWRLPAMGVPYVLERLARQLKRLADGGDSLGQAELVELPGQLSVDDEGASPAGVVAAAPVRPAALVGGGDLIEPLEQLGEPVRRGSGSTTAIWTRGGSGSGSCWRSQVSMSIHAAMAAPLGRAAVWTGTVLMCCSCCR